MKSKKVLLAVKQMPISHFLHQAFCCCVVLCFFVLLLSSWFGGNKVWREEEKRSGLSLVQSIVHAQE